MTEKQYNLRAGYYYEYTGICSDTDENLTTNEVVRLLNELSEEKEELKQELFESKKDYLIETYSDNPTRRDEKIQGLKEEFKERFGDFE